MKRETATTARERQAKGFEGKMGKSLYSPYPIHTLRAAKITGQCQKTKPAIYRAVWRKANNFKGRKHFTVKITVNPYNFFSIFINIISSPPSFPPRRRPIFCSETFWSKRRNFEVGFSLLNGLNLKLCY